MADLKTRPQMDRPKFRKQGAIPKEAAAILQQPFADRQQQRQPGQKNPVQYATDKVESTGKRGTVAAADGMRRVAGHKRKQNQAQPPRTAPQQEHPVSPEIYTQAPETTSEPPISTAPKPTMERARQQFVQKRRLEAARSTEVKLRPSTMPTASGSDGIFPSASEQPRDSRVFSPPTSKERGRRKMVQSTIQKQQRAGQLAEKRTAASSFRHSEKIRSGPSVSVKHPPMGVKQTVHGQRGIFSPGATHARKARPAVQRKTQQKMLEQTTKKAAQAAKDGGQLALRAGAAVGRATASAVSSIMAAGGGAAVQVVLLVVIVIGAITASPFGILFAGESTAPDTVPVSGAVAQVQYDFNAELMALQTADTYDDMTLQGTIPDWAEVLAVFAVKVAGNDGADAADVATLDADRISRLKVVFADMCTVSHTVDVIDHPDSDPDDGRDDSWTEKHLKIVIVPKTAEEMKTVYDFTGQQISMLDELLAHRDLLMELVGDLVTITADASEILKRLPADLSPERKAVVQTACSLVGKVNYFWGGKSSAIGWDSRWGQLKEVTAAGSPTTGTYRPYGLDCSGFVDWVFNNAMGYVIGHGGGAASQHTYCSTITWEEAVPGDLVFYPGDSHVGIVGGRDKNGELLVIHCASGANNVVITGKSGFAAITRPTIYSAEASDGTA